MKNRPVNPQLPETYPRLGQRNDVQPRVQPVDVRERHFIRSFAAMDCEISCIDLQTRNIPVESSEVNSAICRLLQIRNDFMPDDLLEGLTAKVPGNSDNNGQQCRADDRPSNEVVTRARIATRFAHVSSARRPLLDPQTRSQPAGRRDCECLIVDASYATRCQASRPCAVG